MSHRQCKRLIVSVEILLVILVLTANGNVVQLHGAGASFPSEVYSIWMAAYKQYRAAHVTLNMTYSSVGSGAGKQMIMDNNYKPPVTYVGSDIPLSEKEQKRFPDLKAFPVMAGAIVFAFNIKNVDNLNLSISALTGIYNGSIQYWNHKVIQDLNPAYQLPDKQITVIARSDNSGTTYSFTSALAAGSSSWETEYGVFSEGLDANEFPVKWNKSVVDFYGFANRGMTGLILSLPYSIGYATVADVYHAKLKYAMIQNVAGNFVEASKETVQNAILHSGTGLSLLNPEGLYSYPVAAYTFFIMKQTQMTDCSSAIEFVHYVDWFFTSQTAQLECEKLFMVPIEPHVAANISSLYLKTITCKGEYVWSMLENQKEIELARSNSDNTTVYIVILFLSLLATVCIFIFGRQRWIQYKDILNDTWFIKYTEIHFERENIEKLRTLINSPAFDPTCSGVESPQVRYAWETNSIKLGVFKSDLVFLIKSDSELKTNTFKAKKTLVWFRDEIDHANVAKLCGLTRSSLRWLSVYKGQVRATVVDIIRNSSIKISSSGLVVLCKEIILGMEYLHKKAIVHGNLKASCCFVDMAWKVKLTDWHEIKFRACTKSEDLGQYKYNHMGNDDQIIALFWVAPELIKFHRRPTQEGDVYSFGMVMQEIFTNRAPYHEISLPPKETLNAILSCCLRPKFSDNTPPTIRTLMDRTWEMDPAARPSFSVLRQTMKVAYNSDNSLTDCIVQSIEEYASCLERQLSDAKKEIVQAHEASKAVMLDNAPPLVVERFLNNEKIDPAAYKFGTVLACSFVNLSQFVSLFSARDVLYTLEELLTGIDLIVLSKNVNKLSVNGEHLLFASDPKSPSLTQIQYLSSCAISLMNYLERISQKTPARYMLQMKMGLATGPIVVCVTGERIPKYIVVGEAISLAFKMLSAARQRTIRLTKSMYQMIKERSPMFETCILKDSSEKEDDSYSYWLLSEQGLEGRFPPLPAI